MSDAKAFTARELTPILNRRCGSFYSRNAIIGRASRLGLKWTSGKTNAIDRKPIPAPAISAKPVKRRARKLSPVLKKPTAKPAPVVNMQEAARKQLRAAFPKALSKPSAIVCDAPLAPAPDANEPPRNVPLLELRRDGCKWPSGDGCAVAFRFCNAPIYGKGFSYCGEHHALSVRLSYERRIA